MSNSEIKNLPATVKRTTANAESSILSNKSYNSITKVLTQLLHKITLTGIKNNISKNFQKIFSDLIEKSK